MKDPNEHCKNCYFSYMNTATTVECHRYPKTNSSGHLSQHIITDINDWCGEWKTEDAPPKKVPKACLVTYVIDELSVSLKVEADYYNYTEKTKQADFYKENKLSSTFYNVVSVHQIND
jgi:hypothetical protein